MPHRLTSSKLLNQLELIHPKISVFQMIEIASINNRVYRTISSPIIIPHNQQVDLYPQTAEDYVISCD